MFMEQINRSVEYNSVVFTESDISLLYNVYLYNIVELAKAGDIVNIKINKLDTLKFSIQEENPYISENNYFDTLSESIIKNGMYWIFLSNNGMIHEGRHRYNSLVYYMNNNNVEEISFPSIDLQNVEFEKINVKYLVAKNINQILHIGCKIKEKKGCPHIEWFNRFMYMPLLLRYVFYEWEKKYGFWPTAKLCNDYDKLIEVVNGDL